jgi:hypothetical protein
MNSPLRNTLIVSVMVVVALTVVIIVGLLGAKGLRVVN